MVCRIVAFVTVFKGHLAVKLAAISSTQFVFNGKSCLNHSTKFTKFSLHVKHTGYTAKSHSRSPRNLHDTPQRESHKHHAPPTSVT
jgi:hypothetical protein